MWCRIRKRLYLFDIRPALCIHCFPRRHWTGFGLGFPEGVPCLRWRCRSTAYFIHTSARCSSSINKFNHKYEPCGVMDKRKSVMLTKVRTNGPTTRFREWCDGNAIGSYPHLHEAQWHIQLEIFKPYQGIDYEILCRRCSCRVIHFKSANWQGLLYTKIFRQNTHRVLQDKNWPRVPSYTMCLRLLESRWDILLKTQYAYTICIPQWDLHIYIYSHSVTSDSHKGDGIIDTNLPIILVFFRIKCGCHVWSYACRLSEGKIYMNTNIAYIYRPVCICNKYVRRSRNMYIYMLFGEYCTGRMLR